MWFMSLDMASGFWAVRMTERAKLISAFVCPFGHFQWIRMPFGCAVNFSEHHQQLPPPEEEVMVDPEVLEFWIPSLKKPKVDVRNSEIQSLDMTVFRRNIPLRHK
ncbi:hypothetical protein PHMEG_00030740 [Phytophthora megakarya]|uniref:Reverse transcriptase n=1 Tax=Phytophthora megakarya TaxID=4795 RepID=A0A225V279_9STRA|nr:hypothetical protein PHMEG_00030740 [Phytophthora megakarya]